MRILKLLALAFALFAGVATAANDIKLNPNHPDRYVVVKGDTLWDISARFLKDPWLWPEVWQANPQIANPHLIYPGDVITLVYVEGVPRIRVERGPKLVKLTPSVRHEEIKQAIPTIPLDAVQQFLNQNQVFTEDELKGRPYVVGMDDRRLAIAAHDRFYARRLGAHPVGDYSILRKGKEYIDPATKESLGFEMVNVGDARLARGGDPATLDVVRSNRDVIVGDYLVPASVQPILQNYFPHAPKSQVKGVIISLFDAVSEAGRYQVVTINLGNSAGMDVGTTLEIDRAGEVVRDQVTRKDVKLPDEKAGLLMVFRTFDKVSYGLIMESKRAIHIGDVVHNP